MSIFEEELRSMLKEVLDACQSLQGKPGDQKNIQRLFSLVHTIKGTTGHVGPEAIYHQTADWENELYEYWKEKKTPDPQIIEEWSKKALALHGFLKGDHSPGEKTLGEFFLPLIEGLRKSAKDNGKEVEFEIKGSEIKPAREILFVLSRTLIHLLRNALDHAIARHGKITLTFEQTDTTFVAQVSDNGSGIPLQNQLHIFDDFFSTGPQSIFSGRGMGLPIVKKTLEAHQGRISFTSHSDHGTTFKLELPLEL
jgi:chemotaxis protein histidine kinase CheA